MRIVINYESTWRNSFLNGDNNSPLEKKGREYVGSVQSLKKDKQNFIKREITLDTVMGILNRLIGDQRKLYQSRACKFGDTYFFSDLENKITFQDKCTITNEVIYLRNMNGSIGQNSFSGILKSNHPAFSSDYSGQLWGILGLDFLDLCRFILGENISLPTVSLDPLSVCDYFELRKKERPNLNNEIIKEALALLDKKYLDDKVKDIPIPLGVYCCALYVQIERMKTKYDCSPFLAKKGGLHGISKRSFTRKEFLKEFTSGKGKIVWGNPYLKKEKLKGEGEVTSMLSKASGQLEINIDVEEEKGKEILTLIENAGVSAFPLGKKGLAYVSKIRL